MDVLLFIEIKNTICVNKMKVNKNIIKKLTKQKILMTSKKGNKINLDIKVKK